MDEIARLLMQSLPQGFRAVVIGASGGIGSALVRTLKLHASTGEVVPISRTGDGLDLLDEQSIAAVAAKLSGSPVHLMICATGALTLADRPPEKALKQIDPEIMLQHFRVNAIGPALVAKHFLPLLDRKERAIAAFLSARVGSIGDNRLGGWISYCSSKAALNQIVRTTAVEIARTHSQAKVVAVHPGTVRTKLSAPYSAGHPTMDADRAAAMILTTLDELPADGTGSFWAYDGKRIDW